MFDGSATLEARTLASMLDISNSDAELLKRIRNRLIHQPHTLMDAIDESNRELHGYDASMVQYHRQSASLAGGVFDASVRTDQLLHLEAGGLLDSSLRLRGNHRTSFALVSQGVGFAKLAMSSNLLSKVQKQLHTATKTIEEAGLEYEQWSADYALWKQLGSAKTATILKLPGVGDIGSANTSDEDFAEELDVSASVFEPSGVMSPHGT